MFFSRAHLFLITNFFIIWCGSFRHKKQHKTCFFMGKYRSKPFYMEKDRSYFFKAPRKKKFLMMLENFSVAQILSEGHVRQKTSKYPVKERSIPKRESCYYRIHTCCFHIPSLYTARHILLFPIYPNTTKPIFFLLRAQPSFPLRHDLKSIKVKTLNRPIVSPIIGCHIRSFPAFPPSFTLKS